MNQEESIDVVLGSEKEFLSPRLELMAHGKAQHTYVQRQV